MPKATWIDVSTGCVTNKFGIWRLGEPQDVSDRVANILCSIPGFRIDGVFEPIIEPTPIVKPDPEFIPAPVRLPVVNTEPDLPIDTGAGFFYPNQPLR